MLTVRQHDRVLPGRTRGPQPSQGGVDRLRAARGEDDLDRVAPEHRGKALAKLFQESAGILAGAVRGGCVSHDVGCRKPRLPGLRPQRCGGGVVEVEAHSTTLPHQAGERARRV